MKEKPTHTKDGSKYYPCPTNPRVRIAYGKEDINDIIISLMELDFLKRNGVY